MGAEESRVGELMESGCTKKNNIIIYISVFAVLSFAVSLGAAFYGVPVGRTAIFALFQTLGIFIPGVALYLILMGRARNSVISFFCMSYAFGYALIVLSYFPAALFGLKRISFLSIQALLTISAVVVIVRNKADVDLLKPEGADAPFAVVFISFLALSFLAYGGNYPLPGSSRPDISYHADALYWVENSAALTKQFPPQELRMSGSRLFYHYFASIYVAFANRITGIDCFSLSYSLYPFGKCLIVFGGLYELARSFFPERKKRIFFMAALMFSTGFENYTIANYVSHILTLPFGFDLGLAFGAYFLAFLLKQVDSVRGSINTEIIRRKREEGTLPADAVFIPVTENGKNAAASALSILMCAGHKAPVAMIFLVFAGLICIRWLSSKEAGKALKNGIPALVCFAAVMIVCVGVFSGAESRVNAGGFSHVATLRATPLFSAYEETALNRTGLSGTVKTVFLYALQMGKLIILINPLLLFLFIHGLVDAARRKVIDSIDITLILTMGAGLFMGLFNAQEGVSQLYYTLTSYIPGLLFGIRHMKVYLAHEDPDKRNMTAGIASGLMLMQIMLFMGPGGALEAGWKGFFNANSIRYHPNQSEEPAPYSLQLSDYEALKWVRENTPSDSILVSDRAVICDLDNYMYYGTFSERQMYLEGDRYFYGANAEQRNRQRETTRMIFANSYGDLLEAKENGADYIIQTKWITPYYSGIGCLKVYSTDTVNIWEING